MNNVSLNGFVNSVPSITFLPIYSDSMVSVCRFVLVAGDANNYDFFSCIAFDSVAQKIVSKFNKGTNISIKGKIKNYLFKDIDDAPHFTQIILIEQVIDEDEILDFVDEEKISRLYEDVRKLGFLIVDEMDYFYLASNNIDSVIGN